MPKVSSLEALRAFVETGSVSKAAERLGLGRNTLTRKLGAGRTRRRPELPDA